MSSRNRWATIASTRTASTSSRRQSAGVGRRSDDLGAHPREHLGVARQRRVGPDQGVVRRPVAGDVERHRLVAQLHVAHRPPVGVARVEQHREHVVRASRRAVPRAALGDDAVEHPLHLADGGPEPGPVRGRHPRRDEHRQPAELRADLPARHVQGPADGRRVTGDVRPEQRLRGDALGEPQHPHPDVAHLAGPPALQRPGAEVGHRVGVAGDPVHARLHDRPLPAPELPVRADDAVAREHRERVLRLAGVRRERLLDVEEHVLVVAPPRTAAPTTGSATPTRSRCPARWRGSSATVRAPSWSADTSTSARERGEAPIPWAARSSCSSTTRRTSRRPTGSTTSPAGSTRRSPRPGTSPGARRSA